MNVQRDVNDTAKQAVGRKQATEHGSGTTNIMCNVVVSTCIPTRRFIVHTHSPLIRETDIVISDKTKAVSQRNLKSKAKMHPMFRDEARGTDSVGFKVIRASVIAVRRKMATMLTTHGRCTK